MTTKVSSQTAHPDNYQVKKIPLFTGTALIVTSIAYSILIWTNLNSSWTDLHLHNFVGVGVALTIGIALIIISFKRKFYAIGPQPITSQVTFPIDSAKLPAPTATIPMSSHPVLIAPIVPISMPDVASIPNPIPRPSSVMEPQPKITPSSKTESIVKPCLIKGSNHTSTRNSRSDITRMALYLDNRRKQSTIDIADVDKYMIDSLQSICTHFSVNPKFANAKELNLIFQCLALQMLLEGKRVASCEHLPDEFSVSGFTISKPIGAYRCISSDKSIPLEAGFIEGCLGYISHSLVVASTGQPEFYLPNIQKEIAGLSIQEICSRLFSSSEYLFPGARLLAYQLHQRYWSFFKMNHNFSNYKTIAQLLDDALLITMKDGMRHHYFSKDDIDMIDLEHIRFLALFDVIRQCNLVSLDGSEMLELPNGQSIVFPKIAEYYADLEGFTPIRFGSDLNALSVFDWKDLADCTHSEAAEIVKLKTKVNINKIKTYIIIHEKSNKLKGMPMPELTAEEIRVIALLKRLRFVIKNSQLERACTKIAETPLRISQFDNKAQYQKFFEGYFIINPQRGINLASNICLQDSFSFYLCRGNIDLYRSLQRYDRDYTERLMQNFHNRYYRPFHHSADFFPKRYSPEYGVAVREIQQRRVRLPEHQQPYSALGISRRLGLEFEKATTAKEFLSYIGSSTRSDWVTCHNPKASDAEKIRLIQDHGKRLFEADVGSSYPEMLLFTRLYGVQIYFFRGDATTRYRVKLDDSNRPIPDEIIGAPSSKPPVYIIYTDDHFLSGIPKRNNK